jgi:hypothetical protein
MRKIMGEVPRGMEVIAHDDRDLAPLGRQKVSRTELNRRQQAYLGGVVSGDSPLDQQAAEVIRQYLDNHHARQ